MSSSGQQYGAPAPGAGHAAPATTPSSSSALINKYLRSYSTPDSHGQPSTQSWRSASSASAPIATGGTTSTYSRTPRDANATMVTSSPVSSIKSRLQQLARTPLSTGSPSQRPIDAFSIAAARGVVKNFGGGERGSTGGGTPGSSALGPAGSVGRTAALQAELRVRELEVGKLATAAADARREGEELRQRAQRAEAEARTARAAEVTLRSQLLSQRCSSPSSSPPGVESSVQPHFGVLGEPTAELSSFSGLVRRLGELSMSGNAGEIVPASPPSAQQQQQQLTTCVSDASAAVQQVQKEAETLRLRAEMAAAELQGQRAVAQAAEERARLAEARAAAAAAEREAVEGELQRLKQQAALLQADVRDLAEAAAFSEDRAVVAETATMRRSGGSVYFSTHGGDARSAERSKRAAELTEAALTAQVRALAAQLNAAHGEVAAAKQEAAALRAGAAAHASTQAAASTAATSRQEVEVDEAAATASLLSTNRELEAALMQAAQNLEQRGEELRQAKEAAGQLAAETAALRAALEQRDGEVSRYHSAYLEAAARAEETSSQLAATREELQKVTVSAAQLEDSLAKSGRSAGGAAGGPSPLRDVVASLRAELQDRELQLAAAEEEMHSERRRAAEINRQMMDQAVELDLLQREAHAQKEADRVELEKALARTAAAEGEVRRLREQGGGEGLERELEALRAECEALRSELIDRETEVMVLQGQINMKAAAASEEVESWLMAD